MAAPIRVAITIGDESRSWNLCLGTDHSLCMQIETRRLAPADASILSRVADEVFDAAVDPERLAAYLAEPGRARQRAGAPALRVSRCSGRAVRHVVFELQRSVLTHIKTSR
jgi:hypothetical protein